MPVYVVKEKCTGCGQCFLSCPADAVKMQEFVSRIDDENCTKCLICLDYCPHQAIEEK
jgi:Fe-S-cluster-containing hydrogenase component 2